MLFEFRHYKLQDDKRDDWVTFMESTIIPFQQSQGMVVLGSFIDEEDPNSYHWICLLYTSTSQRDKRKTRMKSSA